MEEPLGVEDALALSFQVKHGVSFPGVIYANGEVAEDVKAAVTWAKGAEGRKLLEMYLERHGAVLFRGLPLFSPQDFDDFIEAFQGLDFMMESPIGGGGPRVNVIGPVHTSTESPPEFRIPFHHELAYITKPPTKLFFWCEVAPEKDGETPILLSSLVVQRMVAERPIFVEKLRNVGVKYVRTLDEATGKYQRGWKESFQAASREEAEKNVHECGAEKVEWLSDSRMRVTTKKFEAILDDPRTGTSSWFNAICLLHPAAHGEVSGTDGAAEADRLWDVVYGDGSSIDGDDVLFAKRVMDEEGTKFKWQRGDVLVVDNMLALHSRNSFVPPRRILVAMTM